MQDERTELHSGMSWLHGVALIGWRLLSCHAGASDLERSDPGEGQASKYAILLADTYLVGDGPPAQLTNACPRSWSDAAYFFKVRPPSCAHASHGCSAMQHVEGSMHGAAHAFASACSSTGIRIHCLCRAMAAPLHDRGFHLRRPS